VNESQGSLRGASDDARAIRAVIGGVRARWRRLTWLRAAARVAMALAVVIAVGFVAAVLVRPVAGVFAAVFPLAAAAAVLAVWWALGRVGPAPTDRQVARFIEERNAVLDDRLASAVDLLVSPSETSELSRALVADAARRSSAIDPASVITAERLRRAGGWAAVGIVTLASIAFLVRDTARETVEATLTAVRPGAVAPTVPVDVETSAPRVQRIDVEYSYPSALGLPPRVDEGSGDIFAPAGTRVRLRVHTDVETTGGQMAFTSGQAVTLVPEGRVLSGALDVVSDSTYRIALQARDGSSHRGDTEYFIRVLDDRPPDVRILRPARDREVTPLEEVDIAVQARDDFGVEGLELVYAVAGGPNRVVRFDVPSGATDVTGSRTLYLEDVGVRPGDFVAYYVRARDRALGRPSTEARSDIFFLQVRPFEQPFTLAQSQESGGGGGQNRSIDDLVAAQKEIIVATWKLDRRSEMAGGEPAEADIRAVARAETELKTRVEAASSGLRTGALRDPRRGALPGATAAAPPAEEDAMTAAALALGRAVAALDRLNTTEAMAPEMEALTQLLRAQGEAGERQVTQQAGGQGGGNRASQDLSGLFDRELQRRQQTTYETRQRAGRAEDDSSALDRIRELARRQDELQRQQEELARERERLTAEALKRELERLTREQAELRQRAEELARQLDQQGRDGQARRDGREGQGGQQGQPRLGPSSRSGAPDGRGAQGQQGPFDAAQGSQNAADQMRQAAEEMARAASELRRDDAAQAAARGGEALDRLRQLEQQMGQSRPDAQRRSLGEMQMEAQQLADAERRIADDLEGAAGGQAGEDARRRLAAEQERLARRAEELQAALERQAGSAPGPGDTDEARAMQSAARDAARQMEQSRLAERMRESAQAVRTADRQVGRDTGEARRTPAETMAEAARDLDQIADRLADARTAGDADAQRLASQLSRAEALRDRIESLSRDLERIDREARRGSQTGSGQVAGIRDELARQLEEARELLTELQRDNPDARRGSVGVTFEGQGMVFSAPGTEAFKQDFARWESLRREVTQALEAAGASIAARLAAQASRDRLTSGGDERAPSQYQDHADQYFRAIAGGRQP
jgi:hypothetical protein